MWSWDQGRIAYFQYDTLRVIAKFATQNDLKTAAGATIRSQTGLEFLPAGYEPWRNYARAFKLCLLVHEEEGRAAPTDVAKILSQDAAVTCDEYLHFLAEATTDPSPAMRAWEQHTDVRHPLCFALRYALAKASVFNEDSTPINEIIGAYISSQLTGGEDQADFVKLLSGRSAYQQFAEARGQTAIRQARESILFLCQISYLHCDRNEITVSLSAEDSMHIFDEIRPVGEPREPDGEREIQRLASLFRDGSTHDFFDYQATTVSNELDNGFAEGNKIKKAHTIIERSSRLRRLFLNSNPTTKCDACLVDTKAKYPWTERVLDIHHMLPLSSGTRVDSNTGTLLVDLVPICPTCHRSIHRFYEQYLRDAGKSDFGDKEEAKAVYESAKNKIRSTDHHDQ